MKSIINTSLGHPANKLVIEATEMGGDAMLKMAGDESHPKVKVVFEPGLMESSVALPKPMIERLADQGPFTVFLPNGRQLDCEVIEDEKGFYVDAGGKPVAINEGPGEIRVDAQMWSTFFPD